MHIRINLTEGIQNLHSGKYVVEKSVKEDPSKQKQFPRPVRTATFLRVVYTFNVVPNETPADLFAEIYKLNLKFKWKFQVSRQSK